MNKLKRNAEETTGSSEDCITEFAVCFNMI